MNAQFDQTLLSSFYLWFENRLVKPSIRAYDTGLANSYKYFDAHDIPNGFYAYQGNYRQLVAENEVDVANSGVFINNSFVSGGQSNVYFDFNNGRVVVPASSGKALTITSVSTVKEVNTYLSNDSEEQILLEGDFRENGDSSPNSSKRDKRIDEKTYFLPACFITNSSSENKQFAFGGEEDSKNSIRVMVLAKDNFTLDSILSCFRDSARSCVKLVDYEDFPYGQFFSVKNFPYKYSELSSNGSSFIEEVQASRIVGTSLKEKLNKNFLIGFLDFDLSTYRFPRL